MKEVKWTDDLSVGDKIIDGQHKMLIEHLNNLTKAIEHLCVNGQNARTLELH